MSVQAAISTVNSTTVTSPVLVATAAGPGRTGRVSPPSGGMVRRGSASPERRSPVSVTSGSQDQGRVRK